MSNSTAELPSDPLGDGSRADPDPSNARAAARSYGHPVRTYVERKATVTGGG